MAELHLRLDLVWTKVWNRKMPKTKILIVEDEAITAMDLQKSLKRLGYDAPAIVPSGERAIKKAEELKPDLVLMDIELQGAMDGIEAAGMIRKTGYTSCFSYGIRR